MHTKYNEIQSFQGLKTHDIMSFFNRVNEQAKRICIRFEDKSQIPQVTVRLFSFTIFCGPHLIYINIFRF